jgi:hypothetical protein
MTSMFGIVEDGLSFVVWGTVAFSVVMSLVMLVTRGDSMYDQIGRGGQGSVSRGTDRGRSTLAAPESPEARAEREQEIRQMLQARSDRRVRQGRPPLDIQAEIAKLERSDAGSTGARDASLAAEVRQLVLARNERRRREGQEPLEVESEVQRALAELDT